MSHLIYDWWLLTTEINFPTKKTEILPYQLFARFNSDRMEAVTTQVDGTFIHSFIRFFNENTVITQWFNNNAMNKTCSK